MEALLFPLQCIPMKHIIFSSLTANSEKISTSLFLIITQQCLRCNLWNNWHWKKQQEISQHSSRKHGYSSQTVWLLKWNVMVWIYKHISISLSWETLPSWPGCCCLWLFVISSFSPCCLLRSRKMHSTFCCCWSPHLLSWRKRVEVRIAKWINIITSIITVITVKFIIWL